MRKASATTASSILETIPAGLTAKQQQAVDLLSSRGGEMSVRALENAGVSAAVLSALVKKNIVRIERRPRRHTLDAFLAGLDPASVGEIRYSLEQTRGHRDDPQVARHLRAVSARRRHRQRKDRGVHRGDARRR